MFTWPSRASGGRDPCKQSYSTRPPASGGGPTERGLHRPFPRSPLVRSTHYSAVVTAPRARRCFEKELFAQTRRRRASTRPSAFQMIALLESTVVRAGSCDFGRAEPSFWTPYPLSGSSHARIRHSQEYLGSISKPGQRVWQPKQSCSPHTGCGSPFALTTNNRASRRQL